MAWERYVGGSTGRTSEPFVAIRADGLARFSAGACRALCLDKDTSAAVFLDRRGRKIGFAFGPDERRGEYRLPLRPKNKGAIMHLAGALRFVEATISLSTRFVLHDDGPLGGVWIALDEGRPSVRDGSSPGGAGA